MSVSAPTVPYTRTLAEFAQGLQAHEVPEPIKHETKRIVLDVLGCAVAGRVTPAGQLAVEQAEGEHGLLEATVFGAKPASLMPAAYANTMLSNALDYDVWGPEGHMAPAVVPVALGVAEALDASGSELMAGLVAALEVGGRIGAALRRFKMEGAPQSQTGIVRGQGHVVFAAVAAAGRVLGLTDDQMHHAFGIAGYGATPPTMRKFTSSARPAMTKYDHLGVMAQNGVQAALLARRGFTGDLEILEGEGGFWALTGAAGCDWDRLTTGLGDTWMIPEVSYKWFPTNHSVNNPTITLLHRMMREHSLKPEEIESIEVRRGRAPETRPRPIRNQMDAWMVPAYGIAAGVHDIYPRRSWQEPATYRRQDLLDFMQRIRLIPLREGEVTTRGNYWEHFSPIRVTVTARGTAFEGAQDHLPLMDDELLVAKFRDNVQGFLSDGAAQRVEQACWKLDALPTVRPLAADLTGPDD